MLRRAFVLLLSCAALPVILTPARAHVSAQEPTVSDVLARAAQYVSAFADPTRILIGEELYKHDFVRVMVNAAGSAEYVPLGGHEWTAELAVVASAADERNGLPWLEFRDILRLDGRPVRDGVSRLGMLATQPLALAGPEAMNITRETSNTQQGRFARAVFLPRLTFVFLHAANQARFAFRKAGDRKIDGVKTWEVKYQETAVPTIVSSSTGGDAPSTGSFWIDPATGQVLMSYLKNGDSKTLFDEMTVMYALDKTTGLRLPASMHHQTADDEESRRVQGKATYSKWRLVPCTRGK